jgi:quinol monooxygenase YgiN
VYGFSGTMRARAGHAPEVVELLVAGAPALASLGCHSYVVGTAVGDLDVVCVNEVWDSKAAHDESLQRPEVRDAIARAMPLLTGDFASHEFDVVGGLGL